MASSASGSTSSQPAGGPASVVLKRPAAKQAVRPKTASTRPSEKPAPVQYSPDSDAQAESSAPPAEWAQPLPISQPRWALHAVSVLQEGHHLPARTGHDKTLELNVWSDCSGITSEMFALRELDIKSHALVGVIVKWILYCTCEWTRCLANSQSSTITRGM